MTPEGLVLSACKALLTALKNQGRLTYRRIHVMPVVRGGAGGMRKFTTLNTDMIGMPDFMIFLEGGKTLHVECKAGKGKLTHYQKAWADDLIALGHNFFTVRSVGELAVILDTFGIQHWAYPNETEKTVRRQP